EVPWADAVVHHRWHVDCAFGGRTFHKNSRSREVQIDGNHIGNPGGLYSRYRPNFIKKTFLKFSAWTVRIALQPKVECNFDGMVWFESDIDGLRSLQRANHQTATHKQDHRERDLRYNKPALEPGSPMTAKCSFIFQRWNKIGPG